MKPADQYQTSEAGYDLIKEFEDCKLIAYPDPKTGGDPWTVGWGATGPGITRGTVWTQKQADERLRSDVQIRERIVAKYVTVPITQGMFDALVSIIFNVGAGSANKDGIIWLKSGKPSTLLRKLNAGDYAGARAEFLKWVSPGSNVEWGLRRRRNAELVLWDSQ